jgi:hypothetical protein
MKNIKNVDFQLPNNDIEQIVIITNEDGSETSMTKARYDELEAAKADEAKTK